MLAEFFLDNFAIEHLIHYSVFFMFSHIYKKVKSGEKVFMSFQGVGFNRSGVSYILF